MPRSIRVPAALLATLVLTLTLLATPAVHAGTDRGPAGPADWLTLLWQHLAGGWLGSSGPAPTNLFAPEGGTMDPNGTPQAPPPEGSHMDPNGTPGPVSLAAPEGSSMDQDGGVSPTAGSHMDPNG